MDNFIRAFIAALLLLAATHSARADTYCSGAVYEYLVMADGTLTIRSQWRQDWTAICSVHGTWKNISTETCYSWLAIVNAAKVHNKAAGIYYTGNPVCSSLPTYSDAPAPWYVRIEP